MNRKSYVWRCVTWLVAGSLLGTYLPRTAPSHRVHDGLKHLLRIHPPWLHFPLIVFLFLVAFQPAVDLLRRYRHNWEAKARPFTIVEGTVLFILGAVGSALLNGSIPRSIAGYSHATILALIVWSAASAVFLISAFVCSLFEPKPIVSEPSRNVLMDLPITEDGEDLLGRIRFVDDFYAQIREFLSEDSFVFGLNGSWGSGKTSVLNLLRNRLRRDKNVILVDFNPWYFHSPETIVRRFYESVARAINQEFFYPQLSSTVRRYARILAPLLRRYGIDFLKTDEATVEEVKGLVESYIVALGRRVVIVVDDLERAHQDELLTVLQIVRLGASFKNTLFILAYDQEQILRQLKRSDVSPDFLGKIIQFPTDLPAADKNEIDRFVIYSDLSGRKSELDKLLDKLGVTEDRRKEFDKKSGEIYASKLSPFFPTLRNAKRFLSALSVRLPVVNNEVNLLDFFLLEILRVFAPSVYQDIWINSYYYLPSWTERLMISSPFGLDWDERKKQERRERTKLHVDELLHSLPEKNNVLEVLKLLFPLRIHDAFGRPTGTGSTAAAGFRAEKRLTHPECFDKYFLLAVPKGTISDAVVESILASWANAPDPENTILETLESLSEKHQLVEILDRITVFLGKISEKLANALLRAVSINIRSVPLEGDRSEQDAHFKLMLFLLSEKVPTTEQQTATEAVLRDIKSIDVAVHVANALISDQSDVTWGLRRQLDISHVKKIMNERFAKEFVETRADIFARNNHPRYVLYQIGTYDADSAQMINSYAMALLEKNPQYIGKLIDGFLIEFPGGGPKGFQFEQLKSVYDHKHLAELAQRAGEHAWSNEKEKRAIETLLRLTESLASAPQ